MSKTMYKNSSCDNLTNPFHKMYVCGCLARNKIHILLTFVIICSVKSNFTDTSSKAPLEVKKNSIIANLIILKIFEILKI